MIEMDDIDEWTAWMTGAAPKVPKATFEPLWARPLFRPFCCLRYFVFFGCNILLLLNKFLKYYSLVYEASLTLTVKASAKIGNSLLKSYIFCYYFLFLRSFLFLSEPPFPKLPLRSRFTGAGNKSTLPRISPLHNHTLTPILP